MQASHGEADLQRRSGQNSNQREKRKRDLDETVTDFQTEVVPKPSVEMDVDLAAQYENEIDETNLSDGETEEINPANLEKLQNEFTSSLRNEVEANQASSLASPRVPRVASDGKR